MNKLCANGRYWTVYMLPFDHYYCGAHVVYYFPPSARTVSACRWIVPGTLILDMDEELDRRIRRAPASHTRKIIQDYKLTRQRS